MPLLWKVNISARKRITLMALFGGAAFCIMATIIRGVTILKSGPNGAVEGSKWACRETFVAIVVSNLPIIHPLLRKAAHSTGLSFLFSSSAKASRSHPLTSKNHKSTRDNTRRKGTHPLSLPGDTAWGSDEHILSPGNPPKEITVVKETIVRSDPWTEAERGRAGGAGAPVEWGTRSSDERVARIERSSSDRQRHARHR
ncbi:hypothetical protein FQN50_004042 [Emmonsiellopsis sp. PD_5]|nr:hypothetical protein FQN50_004042 [Emmonsiellopsis sp. PD_5]